MPDGEVGVLTKQGGGCRITFATRSGVAVPPDTELEVVKHPAELAMEALKTYNTDAKQAP